MVTKVTATRYTVTIVMGVVLVTVAIHMPWQAINTASSTRVIILSNYYSPLPDALSKKPKLDVDTSPLLVPRQTQQDEANLAKKEIEETRGRS